MNIKATAAAIRGVSSVIAVLCAAGSASAQQQPQQILDRVQAVSPSTVLEMTFDDPDRTVPFIPTGIAAATAFNTCQITNNGLYCLDGGQLIRRWVDTTVSTAGPTEFSCADTALNLDTRKPAETCPSFAVDQTANVFIGGKNGSTYSLIKVFPEPVAGCTNELAVNPPDRTYCFQVRASGRPIPLDIVAIDGSAGERFRLLSANVGPGQLVLEGSNTVVFFRNSGGAPDVIGSGKAAWGLVGNEALQSITLLQRGENPVQNHVVATTNTGRILRKNTASLTAPAVEVFNLVTDERPPPPPELGPCDASAARYAVRASAGVVYATVRNSCQVIALEPDATFANLVHVLTLDTQTESESHPPITPSVAPGIVVDLHNCGQNQPSCPFVVNEDGFPIAELSEVTLDSSTPPGADKMIVAQIKRMPDCRYLPSNAYCIQKIAEEGDTLPDGRIGPRVIVPKGPGIIVDPTNVNFDPQLVYLNAAALFPQDIHDLVAPDVLPEMLISPLYRGQEFTADPQVRGPFEIEGFFGLTNPDVRFRGVFSFEVHVDQLSQDSLGCELGVQGLDLDTDISTFVSERFATPGGPTGDVSGPGKEHVDILANGGCGSTKLPGGRWSFNAYNLELAEREDDAAYAIVLDSIFNDLGETLTKLACTDDDFITDTNPDPVENPPLSPAACSSLTTSYSAARVKLTPCLTAMSQPKQSAVNQNCQAFQIQYSQFKNALQSAVLFGDDPGNRFGELIARTQVIDFIYFERVLPSVPPGGFVP